MIPGDLVQIHSLIKDTRYNGTQATIVERSTLADSWRLDIPPSPRIRKTRPHQEYASIHELNLKLIYEGDKKLSWDTCVWQPAVVSTEL